MADPEIARRCHHCGVSIREQAFFCPQCGKELDGEPSDTHHDVAAVPQDISKAETIAEARIEAADIRPAPPTPPSAADPSFTRKRRRTDRKPPEPIQSSENAPRPTEDRKQRATAVARDVLEDNVLQRVERLRKVSSVMIDQAGYDPSLRFVLVAAVLFILFLLIVVVSKLIG